MLDRDPRVQQAFQKNAREGLVLFFSMRENGARLVSPALCVASSTLGQARSSLIVLVFDLYPRPRSAGFISIPCCK